MSTTKKSTSKKTTKNSKKSTKKVVKPDSKKVADRKTQKVSITKAIYVLFAKHNPENVTPEMGAELALKINPESKFDKWHLYFHRKNFRALDLAGELEDKIDRTNPVIRKLIEGLKTKPASPKKTGSKKVTSKEPTSKKRTIVRVKKKTSKKTSGKKVSKKS